MNTSTDICRRRFNLWWVVPAVSATCLIRKPSSRASWAKLSCGWSATLEDSDSPLFSRFYSWQFQHGHKSPFPNSPAKLRIVSSSRLARTAASDPFQLHLAHKPRHQQKAVGLSPTQPNSAAHNGLLPALIASVDSSHRLWLPCRIPIASRGWCVWS